MVGWQDILTFNIIIIYDCIITCFLLPSQHSGGGGRFQFFCLSVCVLCKIASRSICYIIILHLEFYSGFVIVVAFKKKIFARLFFLIIVL